MTIEFWAEAGPCDNSVNAALAYVNAAYTAGASALKVQWYNAPKLVVPGVGRYDKTSGSETTQFDMFAQGIYPYSRWDPVIELTRRSNMEFIPSVFDHEAVEYAAHKNITTLKIASGDITYLDLITHASQSCDRIAISTGGSTLDEVADAVEAVDSDCDLILLACHLEYPTPIERANLARTYDLQWAFPDSEAGFSDHTPGIDSIPLIVASGVTIIEKHFTLKKGQGYDSDFALDPVDLRNAILSVERTLTLMGDVSVSPDTDEMAGRTGARRSLYTSRAIPAGHAITPPDIAVLRPGTGLSPRDAQTVTGMAPRSDLPKHHQLSWADFE